MTSLPKAMRRAVLTAKTLATAIAPEFKRTPLAFGGRGKENSHVWWHGSPSGDLRASARGLHLGTRAAAEDALNSRIGFPAEGKWDGTRKYGETKLAGKRRIRARSPNLLTGHISDAPEEDYFAHQHPLGLPRYSDQRSSVSLDAMPAIKPYRIVGPMTNTPDRPHSDARANQQMKAQITKGNARRGFYYKNDGEDEGSVSAVVPHHTHLEELDGDIAKASGGAVDGDDAPDDDSPYYSPLAQGLKGARLETGPAAYWRNTISKLPGAAEAKDTGLHDFIDSQGGDIQKQALLEHLAMNSPQLQEHWFEEDPKRKLHENRPRFTDHTLDGGTNHKELSINLPTKGPSKYAAHSDKHDYISPVAHQYTRNGDYSGELHPADVNRIAHVRMNDRRGPKGEKLLHIDELQSDWHQKGREHGYKFEKPYFYAQNRKSGFRSEDFDTEDKAKTYHSKLPHSIRDDVEIKRGTHSSPTGVPNAPLKDTKQWTELALRRAIKHAADNGYHGITWTTGEQQADRYDLSKQVDSIWHRKNPDGTFQVSAMKDERGYPLGDSISHEKLPDHVGKEIAEKIKNGDGKNVNLGGGGSSQEDPWRVLDGVDLKVGGEGMRKFYDEIVPSVANKIGREHGVQASKIRLPDPEEKNYTIMAPHGGVGPHHLFHGDNPVTSSIHREALERHRDRLLEAHDVHYLPVTPSMAGKKVRKYKRGGTVKPELGPAMMIAANVLNRKKRGQ